MKVYVVTEGYSDEPILGVFSTEAGAEAYIATFIATRAPGKMGGNYEVEEAELDPTEV
jgi:hypothetical protein